MDGGLTRFEAATALGITPQRAWFLLRRGFPSPAEMRDRRKNHIVAVLSNPRTARRNTPHVISRLMGIDETFVEQLILELRSEGRLPPAGCDDELERKRIIKSLQKFFPNVYSSKIVGRKPDQLYIAGKGWVDWSKAEAMAKSMDPHF